MYEHNVEIKNENLDEQLLARLNKATPAQLETIPPALFKKVQKYKRNSVMAKLADFEKIYLLNLLGMRSYILLEDEEAGIDKETFLLWKQASKNKVGLAELAADQHRAGYLVLSGLDLSEGLRYSANASVSVYYRLVRKLGTKPVGYRDAKFSEYRTAFRWFMRGVSKYECGKKLLLQQNQLHLGDFYCLIFFATGEGSYREFMSSDFNTAFSASESNLRKAPKRMLDRGLLMRMGKRGHFQYITSDTGLKILEKAFVGFLVT